MKRWTLTLAMLVLATALVGWNASRFIGAQGRIRTKDLSFLPSPLVGRVMSLGQPTTAAKLRWIDSFAYFQKQLDVKDDTISGSGESAFLRLYDLLLTLDPQFRPMYEHAVLNLGGILGRRTETLQVLHRGLLNLPHDPQLWRLLAVELYTYHHAETRQPQAFSALLNAWHEAMTDPEQAQEVWDWKAAFGRRREPGLDELPYWMTQYQAATGETREFILATLREQIGRYGEDRLTALAKALKARRGFGPVTLQDLLDPALIRQVWPGGVPELAPVVRGKDGWQLRADPYGHAYQLAVDGTITSPGVTIFRFRNRLQIAIGQLEGIARSTGRWPTTLAEATAAGLSLPTPPVGGVWTLTGQSLTVIWPTPPSAAWSPEPQTAAALTDR